MIGASLSHMSDQSLCFLLQVMAAPEGFEPSPAGSTPLTDLESAVVAIQLRGYK